MKRHIFSLLLYSINWLPLVTKVISTSYASLISGWLGHRGPFVLHHFYCAQFFEILPTWNMATRLLVSTPNWDQSGTNIMPTFSSIWTNRIWNLYVKSFSCHFSHFSLLCCNTVNRIILHFFVCWIIFQKRLKGKKSACEQNVSSWQPNSMHSIPCICGFFLAPS